MITSVPGIRVGHWTDARALTGCTVILPPAATIGSVVVPGNAPATRETDVLAPERTRVQEVHAVLLTGGSAFGLGAADGVMRWLEERGIGHETPAARVPIVPAAAIYDLLVGDAAVRPGPDAGYAACEAATDGAIAEGNAGAGTGATVGKYAGFEHISKGGIGSASRAEGGLVVGAIAVVNSIGDVIADDGSVIAGARGEGGVPPPDATATTIACVATTARLSKPEAASLAAAAADGLGRAIRPAATMWDGNVVFALATGAVDADPAVAGALGAEALADAIRRAVRAATDVDGAPAMGGRSGLPRRVEQ